MIRRAETLLALLPLLLPASPALAGTDVLVPKGATWTYLDDGTNQGTAWSAPGFDDSSWASGAAELGYGDGDEATTVLFGADPDNKYATTYFRREFNVTDPSIYATALVRLLCDDGAVVYLNGTEVARRNMPGGAPSYTTFASSTISSAGERTYFPHSIPVGGLVAGTNTLAVEIHQRDGDSSDISFDLELVAADVEIVVRGPYVQLVTPTSAIVRWRTDLATDGVVAYGDAPGNLTQSVSFPLPITEHILQLTGLTPNTTYFYSVGKAGTVLAGDDTEHFFVTPPVAGTKQAFRAWIVGDSGMADGNADAVRDAYAAFDPATHTDLWLMLGDNAYNTGTEVEYQGAVFDTYPDVLRSSPLWTTRGNHDTSLPIYTGNFNLPTAGEAGGMPSGTESYYSFDWANVHFVCLDSEGTSTAVGGAMWTWLESDLMSTDQDWVVAFWHHPPYTKGSHDSDTETKLIQMRTNFLPLLEDHGVDLVLCGHSHSYERSFLIDGHYGLSTTFGPSMTIDAGDGDPAGDGSYEKASAPHDGAVYVVAGSSAKLSSPTGFHPVMATGKLSLGSVILDVDDQQLDLRFLDSTGAVTDHVRILKHDALEGDVASVSLATGGTQSLSVDAGSSFATELYWVLGTSSGTSPGVPVGLVTLPLNNDAYTQYTLANPFAPPYSGFFASLDGDGKAAASLTVPTGMNPGLAGLVLHHAYLVLDLGTPGFGVFASEAVPLTLVP